MRYGPYAIVCSQTGPTIIRQYRPYFVSDGTVRIWQAERVITKKGLIQLRLLTEDKHSLFTNFTPSTLVANPIPVPLSFVAAMLSTLSSLLPSALSDKFDKFDKPGPESQESGAKVQVDDQGVTQRGIADDPKKEKKKKSSSNEAGPAAACSERRSHIELDVYCRPTAPGQDQSSAQSPAAAGARPPLKRALQYVRSRRHHTRRLSSRRGRSKGRATPISFL